MPEDLIEDNPEVEESQSFEDAKEEYVDSKKDDRPVEFSVEDGANALLGLYGDDEDEQEEESEESAEEQPARRKSEEAQDESSVYTVLVDGEEMEVNQSELINGYQRQADYTRKTQQLAEERKALQALKDEIAKEREKYTGTLSTWEKSIDDQIGQLESGMGQLRTEDPEAYAEARDRLDQLKTAKQRLLEEKTGVSEVTQKELTEKQQAYLQEQMRLLKESKEAKAIMPDFFDEAKKAEFAANMRVYAHSQGFDDNDLNALNDHRALILMAKAQKYDQIRLAAANKGKKKVTKNPTRNAKQSARQENVSEASDYDRARKNYKKLLRTGKTRDAGKVLELLYSDTR